jgi:hypothetical protein
MTFSFEVVMLNVLQFQCLNLRVEGSSEITAVITRNFFYCEESLHLSSSFLRDLIK